MHKIEITVAATKTLEKHTLFGWVDHQGAIAVGVDQEEPLCFHTSIEAARELALWILRHVGDYDAHRACYHIR